MTVQHSFISLSDEKYPERLRNISSPPKVLYYSSTNSLGWLEKLNKKRVIAVVGSRRMTPYGGEVTEKLTQGLVANNFAIISGLVYGVDAVAHKTTLSSGGLTIAVMGTDLSHIYPAAHYALAQEIMQSGGALLTEVSLGTYVHKGMFPARNRIVAGLSEAVLITEAAIKSGSMITAKIALEQGKEVFAVPGPITSEFSEGTNYLISQGATPVGCIEDILQVLKNKI